MSPCWQADTTLQTGFKSVIRSLFFSFFLLSVEDTHVFSPSLPADPCFCFLSVFFSEPCFAYPPIEQILFFSTGRQGKGDPLVQTGRSSLDTQWILGSSGRLCA
ncbi:hypothetical protein ILYODFUR_012731 [Ilyodon furcidens]|uniref:Secreted protein n=1 Tax=Ilyodon furcidens TaxID=33524 RepID=A0ABV0TID7_9TELE